MATDTVREKAILAAMGTLVEQMALEAAQTVDPALSSFTQEGSPKIAVLDTLLVDQDIKVTIEERNALWSMLLAPGSGPAVTELLTPWLVKQPMDFIRSSDWNQIQIEAKREIRAVRSELLLSRESHVFNGDNIDPASAVTVKDITVTGKLEVKGGTTAMDAEVHRGNTVFGDDPADKVTVVGKMTVNQDILFMNQSLRSMLLRHRQYSGSGQVASDGALVVRLYMETANHVPKSVKLVLRGEGLDYPFTAQRITTSLNNSLAIAPDGALWACGYNGQGQLGFGNTVNQYTPVQVRQDTDWESVSAGANHTLAIKKDGGLWAWGYNNYYNLGMGNTTQRATPWRVGSDSDWSNISASSNHSSFALKKDGSLWVWGQNNFGQLGVGGTGNQSAPVRMGTETSWVSVSAGHYHTMAIKSDGSLWGWGYNNNGNLGLGHVATPQYTALRVGTDADWRVVFAGYYHYTLAIKSDGSLWAWGYNSQGQLGLGDTAQRNVPTRVGSDTDWASVTGGYYHGLGIKTDGSLWAWGPNGNYQLGLGDTAQRLSPVRVGEDTGWAAVAAQHNHAITIRKDGSIWVWGQNYYGSLGLGPSRVNHNIAPRTPLLGGGPWDYLALGTGTGAQPSGLTISIDGRDVSDGLLPLLPDEWNTPVAGGADHLLATEGSGLVDLSSLLLPLQAGTHELRIGMTLATGTLHYELFCE